MGERETLAVLCAYLPELREQAEAGFWTDTLDMHVADLLGGESSVVVWERIGLSPTDSNVRGEHGPDDLVADLWPAPSLVGDYQCPLRRCPRRAGRDDNGRPPRCWLTDEQMLFTSRNG